MKLREWYPRLREEGVDALVIGPDSREAFRRHFARENLPFRGVPDPDGALLGLLGQARSWIQFGRLPALLAVDPEGRIRLRHMGRSVRDLPDLEAASRAVRPPSGGPGATVPGGSPAPVER